jgi:hypothetical protein
MKHLPYGLMESSGKTEILGLYAQKLSNEIVALDDPTTPSISQFKLIQNYPNPLILPLISSLPLMISPIHIL